jgi:hypothetical protein
MDRKHLGISRGEKVRRIFYRDKSFWKRGTLTVEASVVVPAVCFITAALLMLLFFEHNRVWYLSASAEAAVCANGYQAEGTALPEDAARLLAQTRVREQVMSGTCPSFRISCDSSGCSVSVEGQRFPVFGNRFIWDVQMKIRKSNPVRTLRKIRGVRGIAEEQPYGGNTNRIPQGSSS